MPVHYIIKNSDTKLLDIFLKYNLDLSVVNKFKFNILQYSFKYGTNLNFIKKIIDLKLKLRNELEKITNEQLIYQNDNLNLSEKQQLVYYYLKQLMNIPIIYENYICP